MRVFRMAGFLVSVAMWAQVTPPPPPPPQAPERAFDLRGFQANRTTRMPMGPQMGESAIEGTVVDSVTGQPVKKVTVTLSGPTMRTMMSGADGRFAFEQLPEGNYMVLGTRAPGMPGSPSDPVQVAKAARATGVLVKVTAPAAVSGRVLDEDGDPMAGVQVTLLRADYTRGTLQLHGQNQGITDDRGEYRIHSIPPGRYRLQADANMRPIPMMMMRPGIPGQAQQEPELYGVTFHPNTREFSAATTVKLTSGTEFRSDFRMEKQRATSITGRLVGAPENVRGVHVEPVPREAVTFMGVRSQTRWNEDGTFTITGVPPGRYWLVAGLQHRPNEPAMSAVTAVDTTGGPVNGATLVLTAGVEITGRLRIEGDEGQAGPPRKVMLMPGRTARGPAPPQAEVDSQGRFRFSNVLPGVWDIHVDRLPPGGYLKSMKLGEQDVLRTEMEIGTGSGGAGELEIVLSTKGAQIEGAVSGAKQGTPAQLLAVPEGKERWIPGFMQISMSGPDGRYRMQGLRPGKYRMYAMPTGAMSSGWRDQEVLEALESKSVLVTVEEGTQMTQELKLITAEELAKATIGNL